jgi:hypothetical protein
MKQISNEIIEFLDNFKPTKNLIRPAEPHYSWSMTDKEINPSPEGADLNLQRFKANIPHNRFSIKSKKFLKDIFILMVQGNEYFEKHKNKINVNVSDKIPIGNDFNYMPQVIQNKINNMQGICYEYNFNIYTKKYKASFYVNNKKKDITDLDIKLKKTFIWLFIVNAYSNEKCSQYLNINLYLTDLKKVLPVKTAQIIKQEHANTAFTTSCKKHTEINLFREEEWFKVLIHESFHCNGMDFSELENSNINKKVLSIFPVNSDVRLFETYCEVWAELINVMFISYNKIGHIENLDNYIDKLIIKTEKLLYNERLFSLFQCAKVLHFFGIKYNNLYENDLQSKQLRTSRYKEETQILSYYILKSIYIFFVDDFIEWCIENNTENGIMTLNFNKNTETIDSYIQFIKDHYLNSSYTGSLMLFENWFNNISNKSVSSEIYNTLRMSVNEE